MRITIIGAGFSGSTLATLLAVPHQEGNASAPEICLVGVEESYGRGVAYGEARPEHLLNVRAKQLGADPDNPAGFAQWLNLGERGKDAFLPRLAYGEYLADRLQKTRDASGNLTLLRQEAIAVNRIGTGFRVHLDDGSYFASDQVVLALGALPPQRLTGIGPRLARHPRYIAWPWQDDALASIEPAARVLVIGTGLTMADVVSTLASQGHRGDIVAISRHGLLPQAHLSSATEPVELPPGVLQALRRHDLRQLVASIRSLCRVVPDWRGVVDALRPHAQAFWRGLPERERARFLRHARSYWEVVRHRIAPEMHERLAGLRAAGQLQVRAGRLLRAGLRANTAEVLIRERGEEQVRVEQYDYVVRATGLDTDIVRTTHPLTSHLRESGLLGADAHGLGVVVADDLEVIDAQGLRVPGLYCLGPLLRGQLWEITAVPELRDAARTLADTLRAARNAGHPVSHVRSLQRELVLSRGI